MGDVLKLGGDRAPETPDESDNVVTALRGLADRIEAGEDFGPLEKWVLVFQTTSKRDSAIVSTSSRDSGLSLCEFVYLLESAKLDMLMAARKEA